MKKLLVALLVLGLAAPAMAQTNIQFYGNIRTHLGWYGASQDFRGGAHALTGGGAIRSTQGGPATYVVPGLQVTAPGIARDDGILLGYDAFNSHIGLRGSISDKLTMHMEFNHSPGLRLAYGSYNFGAGRLSIGQMHPITFLGGYSNMVGMVDSVGDTAANVILPYGERVPRIVLSIAGLSVGLAQNGASGTAPAVVNQNPPPYTNNDAYLPRIEMHYAFRTPVIWVQPVAAYQTYKATTPGPGGDSKTIDSYLLGLGLGLNFGPASIRMSGHWLQNPGAMAMGASIANHPISSATVAGDLERIQATFVAGFRFSPSLAAEAGYAFVQNSVDLLPNVEAKQDAHFVYAQLPITITKGFKLIPEVGHVMRGDIKIDGEPIDFAQGNMTYATAVFHIDF